jgi:hypothetical protein
MALPVTLSKVVDAIDESIEGYRAFVNRRTGELFGCDADLLDEEDGDPARLKRHGAKLRAVTASNAWLTLPDEFRCETAAVIAQYCDEGCVGANRRKLRGYLRGEMSVGLLKAKMSELGLNDDWEEFRRERIAELAAAWLTEKGIPFRK